MVRLPVGRQRRVAAGSDGMTSKKHSNAAELEEPKEGGEPPREDKLRGDPSTGGESTAAAGESPQPPAAGEPAGVGDEGKPSVEELEKQIQEAKDTAASHWDTVLRTRAELENLRKRSVRDLENAHKFGLERFASELLPVKDSLELGMAATEEEGVEIDKIREGMALTLKMFDAALPKFCTSEIDPQGEDFNPEFHQAMLVQEVDDQPSGTVVQVIQKGYALNERLIRPALVIVAK
jgi:molecular chaperone GrpE